MPLKGSFKIEDGSSEWVTYTGAPGETVGSVVEFFVDRRIDSIRGDANKMHRAYETQNKELKGELLEHFGPIYGLRETCVIGNKPFRIPIKYFFELLKDVRDPAVAERMGGKGLKSVWKKVKTLGCR